MGERRLFSYNAAMSSFVRLVCLALVMLGCSSEPLDGDSPSDTPPGNEPGLPPPADTSKAQPSAPAAAVPYPSGPYGRTKGAIIQNLRFLGWRNAAAAGYDPARLDVISLSDFYNPDGTKDVRLIALNASAVWCTVCRAEYRQLERDGIYAKYRPKGVEILGVLFEDADYEPARPSDLVVWGGPDGFDVPFPLVIDPAFKTGGYFSSDATPMNMLIDTRNMEILDISMGFDTSRPDVYWAAIDEWLSL